MRELTTCFVCNCIEKLLEEVNEEENAPIPPRKREAYLYNLSFTLYLSIKRMTDPKLVNTQQTMFSSQTVERIS